jgi:hypothetical protein
VASRSFNWTWASDSSATDVVTIPDGGMALATYLVDATVLPPDGPLLAASDPLTQTTTTFVLTAESPLPAGAVVTVFLEGAASVTLGPDDVTWADVTDFAPGLSTVAVEAQAAILAYVNGLDPSLGGDSATMTAAGRLARVYLAAHFGTVTKRGLGAAGGLVSQSAGGLSRSYAGLTDSRSLASTTFGALYLSIIDASPARAPVVV